MKRTKLFFIVMLALAVLLTGVHLASAQDEMAEAHKAAIMRVVDEIFSQGNLDLVDELYAEDFIDHTPNGDVNGREGVKAIAAGLRTAMPDLLVTPELLLANGDWVGGRFKATGTFTGEFATPNGTVPGNGQPIELVIHHIWRFNDDRQLQEGWAEYDNLNFLMQLGVIPMPEQSEETASEAVMPEVTPPEFTVMQTSPEQEAANEQGIIEVVEAAFNQGNVDIIDERFAPDYMDFSEGQDAEAFKNEILALRAAIPDLKANVPVLVSEGNWIMFRFEAEGTFQNPLTLTDGSIAQPTGKPIRLAANVLLATDEYGQVKAEWDGFDNLSYATQFGLIPPAQ